MGQHGAMDCPICNVSLVMSDRQGIEIDYCPQCRGVWLDRGELDKIIERSASAAAPLASVQPPPSVAAQERRHQHYDHHSDERGYRTQPHAKRRKSFLEELFD